MPEAQETSDYPGSLDTWVTLTNKEDLAEQSDINKIKAAIAAVQTEIGTDPAGTLATLKARLAIMMATNGAFAQGTSFPVSPTPVEGQVFYRTDLNGFYIYDGADWVAIGTGGMQLFTANGTYTAPSGAYYAVVTAVGGGGGGGAATSGNGGGGGGGGAAVIGCLYPTTPGSDYAVVVGAGGAGGASNGNAGANGGASTFDSVISAPGGTGGSGNGTGVAGAGGDVATVATLNASGTNGGNATYKHKAMALVNGGNGSAGTSSSSHGAGGASAYGDGGNQAQDGDDYGGGGGGSTGNAGDGGDGFVLVLY